MAEMCLSDCYDLFLGEYLYLLLPRFLDLTFSCPSFELDLKGL